jgi:hypothetical protein
MNTDGRIAERLLREARDDSWLAEKLFTQKRRLPSQGYLRIRVRALIKLAESQLGLPPPNRTKRRRRYRAIELLLGHPAEVAAWQAKSL